MNGGLNESSVLISCASTAISKKEETNATIPFIPSNNERNPFDANSRGLPALMFMVSELLGRLDWMDPFEEVLFGEVVSERVGLNLGTQRCSCIIDEGPCIAERALFCYDRIARVDRNHQLCVSWLLVPMERSNSLASMEAKW